MSEKVIRRIARGALFLFFAVALFGAAVPAQEVEKVIRLKDGTVLRGTVVPDARGVFRIQTPSLGEVQIDPAQIVSVETAGAVTAAAGTEDRAQMMKKIKSDVMGDPALMGAVMQLAQDEKIAALMKDDKLQAAVMSMDFDYLKNSEAFQVFADHPDVQAIVGKFQEQKEGEGHE